MNYFVLIAQNAKCILKHIKYVWKIIKDFIKIIFIKKFKMKKKIIMINLKM